MSDVARTNLPIKQGATFRRTFTWYGNGAVLREIESITPGAPTVITVTGHGLSQLSKTPVFISGVKGAPGLNTGECKATPATYVTDDTFSVPVNTVGKVPTLGVVEYMINTDLTTYTARLQFREKINDENFILELTDGSGIALDADGGITIEIDDATTAALTVDDGVFDCELIAADGTVTRILEGTFTVSPEVTR
jgi:hypothetical protein